MRISLIQADLKLGDVDANLTHLEEMMSNSLTEKPDVIVLPEMWNTSFFPENVAQLADEEGKMAKDFLGAVSYTHLNLLLQFGYSFFKIIVFLS